MQGYYFLFKIRLFLACSYDHGRLLLRSYHIKVVARAIFYKGVLILKCLTLDKEALDIKLLRLGIEVDSRDNFFGMKLLYKHNVVGIVPVGDLKVGELI